METSDFLSLSVVLGMIATVALGQFSHIYRMTPFAPAFVLFRPLDYKFSKLAWRLLLVAQYVN